MADMKSRVKHAFDGDAKVTLRDVTDGAEVATVDFKAPVRVATTVAGTLASSFENGDTIDGVVLATNDRILIKNQVAAAENGIYTVEASGAPTRATDADEDSEVNNGLTVHVTDGTANSNTLFHLTTADPITVGVTGLTFEVLSAGTALVPTIVSETAIAIPALTKAYWDNNELAHQYVAVEFNVTAAVNGNGTEAYTLAVQVDSALAFDDAPVTVWSQAIPTGVGTYVAILDADTMKALDANAAFIRASVTLTTGFEGTPSLTYGARMAPVVG